jgi:hypothetical protein
LILLAGQKVFGKDQQRPAEIRNWKRMFPPRPLDATNKAGMYMELLQAWGNNGSVDSYNMAITPPNIFLKKEQPTLVLFLENLYRCEC